jgi:hypothetical protein
MKDGLINNTIFSQRTFMNHAKRFIALTMIFISLPLFSMEKKEKGWTSLSQRIKNNDIPSAQEFIDQYDNDKKTGNIDSISYQKLYNAAVNKRYSFRNPPSVFKKLAGAALELSIFSIAVATTLYLFKKNNFNPLDHKFGKCLKLFDCRYFKATNKKAFVSALSLTGFGIIDGLRRLYNSWYQPPISYRDEYNKYDEIVEHIKQNRIE